MHTDDTDFTDVQAFQRFVDMFGRNPSLQRILKHNFGFEYNPELQIPDDPGDDYENWRGLRGPFHEPLRHIVVTPDNIEDFRGSFSSRYQLPLHIYASSRDPSRLTSVEAKENESKAKLSQKSTKSERKKKKKLKQKERKRQEKLEMEKQQTGKKEEETDKAQQGGEDAREPGRQEEGATNGKPAAAAEDAQSSGSSEEESSDGEEDATYDSCASEELDMTSSFVSKAAQIARRKVNQKPKPTRAEKKAADKAEHKTSPKKPPEGQEADKEDSATPPNSSLKDYVKISNDLAVIGNMCASKGDFKSAVSYFTQAIKCNPTEYKLFGNRSFCFEKLQEYEKALTDAELSLGICPGWVKGLFRKGRALAGLKRYDEATQAFGEVLAGDASCAEAAHELMRVQITQLMGFGFTREQSSNALIIHGTVKKALEVLSKLNCGTGAVQSCPLPPLRVANVSGVSPVLSANSSLASPAHTPSPPPPPPPSLGAAAAAAASARAQDAPKKTPLKAPSAAATNPSSVRSQPPELFPIWVGNLNPTISESVITNLFNKAGTVHSTKILSNKRCAFVNYTKQESCGEAIRRFSGYLLNGVTLAVRYPDRIPPGLNISRSAHVAHHH